MKRTMSVILLVTALALLGGLIFLTANSLKRTDTSGQAEAESRVSDTVTAAKPELAAAPGEDGGTTDVVQTDAYAAQTAEPAGNAGDQSGSTADVQAQAVPADDTPAQADGGAADQDNASGTGGNELYVTTTINIRSEPNTDSEVLGQLHSGAKITKTGDSGDWTEFEYEGSTAYVKTEYLTAEKPGLKQDWDLSTLSTESVNFGYSSANRDDRNVPTDWEYYDSKWGEFAVKWIGDTSQNTIYLTMDEGFPNENTATILETLKEKGVHVTFFLTKNFVDGMPDTVRQMIDEGHQIGNHTCTHPDMSSLSVEEQTDQIMTLHEQVSSEFGYDMHYFRFPMGIYSSELLGLVNNLGYETVFWSYAYNDYEEEQPPVDESLEKALGALHPGAIYLLHADSDTNMQMLADFIDGARERGFEFGELEFLV